MSYYNYYQKKEKRKSEALEHFRKMDILMKDEIRQSVKETKTYGGNGLPVPHTEKKRPGSTVPNITVEPLDTVSALFLHQQRKTAVLNFASYQNPGGGFLEGSSAQEECLCHASTLYNILIHHPEFYTWNSRHKNNSLYTDRALYSKDIIFFDNGDTLTPPRQLKADVLTCAAPNYSAASKHGSVSADENLTALLERIRFVLDVAEDNHVDTLILGAFGCGVFGQDAAVVACGVKRWLEQRDYRFKDVCFAVPDTGKDTNYKKFRLMISGENR